MTTPENTQIDDNQIHVLVIGAGGNVSKHSVPCLLYTSDAADE